MPQSTTSAGRVDAADQPDEAPARTARAVHFRARISCVEACSCRHCRACPVPCTPLGLACITPLLEGWSMLT